MNALPNQSVQIAGERRDQRLALARPHLSNFALMQNHPANQLDIIMTHVQHTPTSLAHSRKGFHQDIVKRRSKLKFVPELSGFARKLGVRKFFK